MDLKKIVNKGINDLSPYEPGKPIEDLERELGIKNAVKLASNENPVGPSPKVLQSIENILKNTHRYPDGNATKLKEVIGKKFSVKPNQVTIGNGSNDIIEFIARSFLGTDDSAIYSEHAFAVYPLVVKAVGAEGIEVPAKNFSHDLDAMLDSIKSNTKIIFIANPNNPTGSFIGRSEILKFLDKVPENIIVLLDQAYFDYSSFEDSDVDFDILNNYPNLVMSRSFSKAYGLAGFRIGYSVSSEDVANYLNRVRQPFNANSLALFAAEQAIEDEEFMNKCLQLNLEQKKVLYKGLESLGFHCLPSKGNFISFDCKEDSTGLFNRLLSQGVIVRTLGVYKMPNFLRVSVGLPEENLIFLEKLQLTMS
ncbi:histidinol-phosphate transaminase [Gammaproteobacteria bacterium]|jgi:histidinol-phosphate aminotransferase|nr:histidinol-phosphate transaminase [Gammaproteobacteria bacterium]